MVQTWIVFQILWFYRGYFSGTKLPPEFAVEWSRWIWKKIADAEMTWIPWYWNWIRWLLLQVPSPQLMGHLSLQEKQKK